MLLSTLTRNARNANDPVWNIVLKRNLISFHDVINGSHIAQ